MPTAEQIAIMCDLDHKEIDKFYDTAQVIEGLVFEKVKELYDGSAPKAEVLIEIRDSVVMGLNRAINKLSN